MIIQLSRLITSSLFSAALALAAHAAPAAPAAKTGDIVLPPPVAPLQPSWRAEGPGGFRASLDESNRAIIFVVAPGDSVKNNKISYPFPADTLRGATIRVSARFKAEGVSARPNVWNGPKLLFKIATDSGGPASYPDNRAPVGTYDWKEVSVTATIPPNASSVQLVTGLENVTGKLWVSDLKVTVLEGAIPVADAVAPSGSVYTGHTEPLLRGAMVPTTIKPESLHVLAEEWGANNIRWQLGGTRFMTGLETPDFEKILQEELATFDAILPFAEKYGLRVVLDLHSLSKKLFGSPANQDRLVAVWRHIATRYKGRDIIWGYDIANEPVQSDWGEGALLWNDLATRVARAIHEIDPVKTIIVEPTPSGNPEGFESLRPVPVANVVYSVHMYHPFQLTHSRVKNPAQDIWTYPGVIDGKNWDKAELERSLAPVINFQKRYNVQIYVGEFGVVRWAPGATRYLSDLIEIFEEHKWDWSVHAFREWHGWSPEHTTDINNPNPSPTPTDREQLLRSSYSKNKK